MIKFLITLILSCSAMAVDQSIIECSRGLASTDESIRQHAIRSLLQLQDRNNILSCLDFRHVPDIEARLGAIKGIEIAKINNQYTSLVLAWSSVNDPNNEVRTEAAGIIKRRNDNVAINSVINNLLNENQRANAFEALRIINNKYVYYSLLKYCTLDINVAMTDFVRMNSDTIQAPVFVNNGGTTWAYNVSLPIQFPCINVCKVRTTVCVPAMATLCALSGQNFGDNEKAWRKWIDGNIK